MSEQKSLKKSLIKEFAILVLVIAISGIILFLFPDKSDAVISTTKNYFLEMIFILPAIMVLMGLFAVFVPDKFVFDHLGKGSGLKGMITAILLGTLPTGPLYIAFPLAALWIKKGASISNIVVFLAAWACIKIPQELVELQFLGFKFMSLRLVLTVVFVIIMGFAIEKIIDFKNGIDNKTYNDKN